MKKILTLVSAAFLAAASASAANLQVTFNGEDNANWNANESATVANGHLYVDMDIQANEKYRCDLKFASNDEPINLTPSEDQILAIKFIGARPQGNMTLEFKNSDGTWFNSKWKNSPQGTVGTPGGNNIYYYELNRDENYTGDMISIINLNFKIADCAAEPYSYVVDWIATYPSVEALNADVAWADDGEGDNDEAADYESAVMYSTVTGNVFSDLASAIDGAVEDDIIAINEPVELKDRMTISKNITFIGAKDGVTITRNFKNKLFLIIAKSVEVSFENVTFCGNSEDCSTPFLENNGKLTLKNVIMSDIKSAHNQGIVAIKQGGRLTANDLAFDNCEVTDNDGRRSTVFMGTNCSMLVEGNCSQMSVYIEKANGAIEAGMIDNVYPIYITLGDMANRELGSVVVKNCEDPNRFALTDDSYLLSVMDGNLVLADLSGVTSVVEESQKAEYFNLQGIRVENPSNGIYIMRKGQSVSKVAFK